MTFPPMRAFPLALLALAAAACTRTGGSADRTPRRPQYLADVPMIPRSIVNDTTGTPEVEHRGLVLQWPYDSVLAFYRRQLPALGWKMMSDVADTAQASLYLQKDTVALWVQIHSIGPLATEYALTAAGSGGVAGRPAR